MKLASVSLKEAAMALALSWSSEAFNVSKNVMDLDTKVRPQHNRTTTPLDPLTLPRLIRAELKRERRRNR